MCSYKRFKVVVNLSAERLLCKLTLQNTFFKKTIWLVFFIIFLTNTGAPDAQQVVLSNGKDRQTVQMLQAIRQNQWDTARKLTAQANDPLGTKLYQWLLFSSNKEPESYTRLVQFIRYNPHWPGLYALKIKAEETMPETLSPAEVTAWFDDYAPVTVGGMDRYANALISQGKQAKAKKLLQKWWATRTMSRNEQREIYRKYHPLIDRTAHALRFDAMLWAGSYKNAQALADVLGDGYPALAKARIALATGRPNVNDLIAKVPGHLHDDPGLMYERLRWRRKNDLDVRAMEILHNAPQAEAIQNPDSWWRERHIIIRRLIERKHYESAYLLAKDHRQKDGLSHAQAEFIAGWIALRFLNKPTEALQHFEMLHESVGTPISLARAAYWAGRAAQATGTKEVAERWYRKAARFQTVFYGQTAGAELGMEEALPYAAPPKLTPHDINTFEKNELVRAARLLNAAHMNNEAGVFLGAFVNKHETPKAYRFSAELASGLRMHDRAVRIAKSATNKGLFLTAQSYPVIIDQLKDIPVEWALIHGLIRQESIFDPDARSPAGALGLMQLMPSTAKEIAGKIGVRHKTAWLTQRPSHNIKLGSAYLDQMLKRYDGYYPMAIAAYNAGPYRVDKWVETFGDPRKGEVDVLDWMEMIPIYETRNYVQRVLESVYVYRLRLKDIQENPTHPIHISLR